jgi:hypothetical protein
MQRFLDYILHLEDSFMKNFSVYTKSTTVGGIFQHCPTFPVEYMLKLFLRMHIYYTMKFGNRNFASKKESRKYIKPTYKPHLINYTLFMFNTFM